MNRRLALLSLILCLLLSSSLCVYAVSGVSTSDQRDHVGASVSPVVPVAASLPNMAQTDNYTQIPSWMTDHIYLCSFPIPIHINLNTLPILKPAPPPSPEPKPVPEKKPSNSAPANHKLYILMYHHFVEGDGKGLNPWTLTVDRLRTDLQWLKDNGYTTVLPSELVAGVPLPEKAVMLTFDDGYISNYYLAYPLLQEFQSKAVISLVVEGTAQGKSDALTWAMCQEMIDSGLVEIGSHTYDSHKENPRGIKRMKNETRQDYETRIFSDIQKSIDLIQENLGVDVQFFAYPHGQTEPWATGFIQENFSVSVTTKYGSANISKGLYSMPRYNVSMAEPPSNFLP